MKLIFVSLLIAMCAPALAQVNKCKGPGGKVIYSDAACDTPEKMQGVKITPNAVDASGDRRNAEDMRAKSEMEELRQNPPIQCRFSSYKYKDEKGKQLAFDAQQECLQNVIAERKGAPISDRKYQLWNDHHTLTTQKRNAAVSNAINSTRRQGGMTCRPNPMGTALDCQPSY